MIRAMLVSDAYTPNYETDAFVSDIVANEVSGADRLTLTGVTYTYNATAKAWELKYSNGNFGSPAAGPTIGRVVLFKFITNDAASPLLIDDDTNNAPTNGQQVDYTAPANGHQIVQVGA